MKIAQTLTGHKGPIYALCQGQGKDTFLSGSGDGNVVKWMLDGSEHGDLIVNVGQAIFSMYLDNDPGLLLIGTEGGDLYLIDMEDHRELQLLKVHQKGVFRIERLGKNRFVCAGGDGSLSIWALEKLDQWRLHLLRQIPLVEEKLRDLSCSPDGSQLAVACGDGTVRLFDTAMFNEIHTIDAHPGNAQKTSTRGASSIAFHPAKPVLISGGKDGHLRFWRTDDGMRPLHAIPAHKGSIYRILFDRTGALCATSSRDATAKVWDPSSFEMKFRLDRSAGGHTHSINDILWMGNELITASDDRRLKSWNSIEQNAER